MADKQRALRDVVKAHRQREQAIERARTEFSQALLRARDAGCTLEEIGAALGISHVAVSKAIRRTGEAAVPHPDEPPKV